MCNSLGKAAQRTSGWIMSYSAIAPLRQQIYFDMPVLDLEPFGLLTCVFHAAFFHPAASSPRQSLNTTAINIHRAPSMPSRPLSTAQGQNTGLSLSTNKGALEDSGGFETLTNTFTFWLRHTFVWTQLQTNSPRRSDLGAVCIPHSNYKLRALPQVLPIYCSIDIEQLRSVRRQPLHFSAYLFPPPLSLESLHVTTLRPEQTPIAFFCNLIFTWTFSIVADFARSRVRVSLEWRAGLKSRGDLEDEIFYFRCGL
ncbi:hypothetical protein K438DRAFT_1774234 [Mycena galopus ATCC 62051]|nr:hypothetical protein K438DRAFT_1774234 [Mycena galopus ATCC 62051]